jgi:hypothetical protein
MNEDATANIFGMRYSFPPPPPLTWMKATGWRRKLPGPDSRRSYENQRTSHFDSDSVALHRRLGGFRDMRKLFYAAARFVRCCYRNARQLVPFVRLTPAGNQTLPAPRHCVSGRARGVCVPRQELATRPASPDLPRPDGEEQEAQKHHREIEPLTVWIVRPEYPDCVNLPQVVCSTLILPPFILAGPLRTHSVIRPARGSAPPERTGVPYPVPRRFMNG